MHRFLFHVDEWLPDNRWFLTVHFLLHGVHHYLPTDRYLPATVYKFNSRLRLVMPPTLFVALAYPWYKLARAIFPYHVALAIYSGGIAGYITYDLTHYFLHHRKYVAAFCTSLMSSLPSFWRELKRYHLAHHYKNFELGYGVTSKFWDLIFGNLVPKS
jgi:4-hydroxysphinganine ceramide fatty acyl 2-hydroxylase